jgi:ABC-type transport system substrate-binding protein
LEEAFYGSGDPADIGNSSHRCAGTKIGWNTAASMSMLEEATWSVEAPIMAVFNNLVVYKPDERQNRLDTIVPDLATEWSWNADKTALTFKLRQGDDCVMPPIRSRARIGASMRH